MALTSGFYDSLNGDRKYNAFQMSSIFDGIIKDGVYAGVGTGFAVTVQSGMEVAIDSGRAWFNHTWTYNNSKYTLTLEAADTLRDRIDAVVLEVNSKNSVRANSFKVVKGTPATNPARPSLTKSGNVFQYALAYILVKAKATELSQADVSYVVGTGETPYVTGVMETVGVAAQVAQWNAEFNEWFENLKSQLSGDVAANLQRQIDAVNARTARIEEDYEHLVKIKEMSVVVASDSVSFDISSIPFSDYSNIYLDFRALVDGTSDTSFDLYFNSDATTRNVYWRLGMSYGDGCTMGKVLANVKTSENPKWADRITLPVGKQANRLIRAVTSDGCGRHDTLTYGDLQTLHLQVPTASGLKVEIGTRLVIWGEK